MNNKLSMLIEDYRKSPDEFHATSYWEAYENSILKEIDKLDFEELRSGKYPIFATFGFNEVVYYYHPNQPFFRKLILKLIRNLFIKGRSVLPYSLNVSNIREMAYRYCLLYGQITEAKSITKIEASSFGKPKDIFNIDGRHYTMQFLNSYLRYCFAHQFRPINGSETMVELACGSGHQIEILKKLYPDITILCYDLPTQIYLCEEYLSRVFEPNQIIGTEETRGWKDLSGIKKGCIHFFGNWQFPLLKDFKFDIFWSAASFGEMEPDVVKNYLSYVLNNFEWIYLLQARHGKEIKGKIHVNKQTTFEDYNQMLKGYELVKEHDAYTAIKKMSQSGGYFEAIWRKM